MRVVGAAGALILVLAVLTASCQPAGPGAGTGTPPAPPPEVLTKAPAVKGQEIPAAQALETLPQARRQFAQDLQNPATAGARIWVDRHPKAVYAAGDTVTIQFAVSHEAHVTVMDLGTSGKLVRIFPNKLQPDDLCKAGVVYSILPPATQFSYVAGLPAGTETLKLYASLQPFDDSLGPAQKQKYTFAAVKEGPKKLSERLAKQFSGRPAEAWATAWCSFDIVERPKPGGAPAPAAPADQAKPGAGPPPATPDQKPPAPGK